MFFLKHSEILKLNVIASKICFLLDLLPYMGYIGMCDPKLKGMVFKAFWSKRASILATLVNRVWFLHFSRIVHYVFIFITKLIKLGYIPLF